MTARLADRLSDNIRFIVRIGAGLSTAFLATATLSCNGWSGSSSVPLRISDVHILDESDGLVFMYRTESSSADCNAQRKELPKVWDSHVTQRLGSNVTSVTLVPEDSTLRSVGFTFERSKSGEWTCFAPCRITISQR